MIENITNAFNVDIIKITIKDKPESQKKVSEDSLKRIFEALKVNAQRERRLRELQTSINEKNAKRKLHYYFTTWYYCAITRKKSANNKKTQEMSKDRKIELFIKAIAEKQSAATTDDGSKKSENQKRSPKKTPVNLKKTPKNKQKPPLKENVNNQSVSRAPAENRLKAQKIIIEEQRAKLAEQNKFIQNIKIKEIDKEAKETTKQTIDVAKQALIQCNQKNRRSLIYLMREEGCRFTNIEMISFSISYYLQLLVPIIYIYIYIYIYLAIAIRRYVIFSVRQNVKFSKLQFYCLQTFPTFFP